MRAMVMTSIVDDLSGRFLELRNVPEPTPTGPHDVVVRVAGAGVCRTELHLLSGGIPVEMPHILGHEIAGYVEAIGDHVTTVAPGDPVLCYPFLADGLSAAERRGIDSDAPLRVTPGIDAPGGFAELVLSHERAMVPLPPGTDPVPLAPLTDAGLAAYRACTKAELRPGDSAVVIGVGGLGHLAIQILRALTSARIVAVDTRPEARGLAEECGADVVCAPPELDSVAAEAATVLDFVGSDESLKAGLDLLGFGGHLISVGVGGGSVSLPVFDLVTSERRIEGVYVGTYQDQVEVTRLALDGKVVPRVVTYALENAERALRDLAAGVFVGRAVLVP